MSDNENLAEQFANAFAESNGTPKILNKEENAVAPLPRGRAVIVDVDSCYHWARTQGKQVDYIALAREVEAALRVAVCRLPPTAAFRTVLERSGFIVVGRVEQLTGQGVNDHHHALHSMHLGYAVSTALADCDDVVLYGSGLEIEAFAKFVSECNANGGALYFTQPADEHLMAMARPTPKASSPSVPFTPAKAVVRGPVAVVRETCGELSNEQLSDVMSDSMHNR